ncbi:DUF6691 family protein [Vibrio hippocampi]|uniref:YeeE/YedE family protein n=1 Tax=Vibrio hippocampi TaxID=654686 RepID=A0ABM8ZM42_9VIBR|nr:DUF6691 family protein [Vibrio hippocampi]CAH0529603.1 hypothetical protein VHP8226_03358 [Vibrio hippocampi]
MNIIAFISGLLFGIGMIVSGMSNPENVIAFLDVAGDWRIDLAFVMGGALLVFAPVYWFVIAKRHKPIIANSFSLAAKTLIDRQLIIGASLFGIGWGIAGICPGPAIASMSLGSWEIFAFIAAMLLGMKLAKLVQPRISS